MTDTVDPVPPARQAFPPDLIPDVLLGGSLNILAGAPGVGKTALFAWMLGHFREDRPPVRGLFGHAVQKAAKIGILTADRSWAQSGKRWFDLAGFSDVCQYCFHDDPTFVKARLRSKPRRVQLLDEFIGRLEPLPFGSLVLADPLTLFLGGNLIDYDTCFVAAAEMREVCHRRGITLIGTAHSAKQKADKKTRYERLQDRILGSTGIIGFTDTAMYLAAPEELNRKTYTFLWAPHHHKTQEFSLIRTENGLFVPADQAAGEQSTDIVLQYVPHAPACIPLKELQAHTANHLSRASLFRRLQEMEAVGSILKPVGGRYQRPPIH
jgi:hypothetical protein